MAAEEHILDLLPAYALGSLDEEERALVADHLKVCGRCRAELRAYEQVADDLPLAMLESEPPASLKDKIMRQASKDRRPVPEPAKPSWRQKFAQTLSGAAPAWGLVSLALILVLGISNLFLWQRLNSLESASQSSFVTVALQGTDAAPGATGLLVISHDGKFGTLVVDELPELDQAHQYQLWLIQDGQRTNGGVFTVDLDGYGNLWISSPLPLINYSAFGITIEPAGGSPGPTGDKVLGGQL